LPLHSQTSAESSYWLFGSQVAAEALAQAVRDVTICDRTVLDLYPFAQHALISDMPNAQARQQNAHKLAGLRQLITDYIDANPYQFLFYVPAHHEFLSTPLSPEGVAYQNEIDTKFRAFLDELSVRVRELRTLSTYDRLNEALRHLQGQI